MSSDENIRLQFDRAKINFWRGIGTIVFFMVAQTFGLGWYLGRLVKDVDSHTEALKILVVKIDGHETRLGRLEGKIDK